MKLEFEKGFCDLKDSLKNLLKIYDFFRKLPFYCFH